MNNPNASTANITDSTIDTPTTTPADADAAGPEARATPATGQTGPFTTTRSAVRATTVAAVSVVAAVAAVVSFMHMYELAARAGEGWRAWLVPLAIDGLVVAASMTMVMRRRTGRKASWLAWISMTLGITASLAANIAAAEPTLIGRAVAAWPPIALLLAYELLMDQLGTTTKHAASQPGTPTTATAHGLAAVPPNTATARHDGTPSLTNGNPAAAALSSRLPLLIAVPDRDDNGKTLRQAARQRYLTTLADGLPCSGRELADMYGMSERWGRYQIRAARRTLTTHPPTALPHTSPSTDQPPHQLHDPATHDQHTGTAAQDPAEHDRTTALTVTDHDSRAVQA